VLILTFVLVQKSSQLNPCGRFAELRANKVIYSAELVMGRR